MAHENAIRTVTRCRTAAKLLQEAMDAAAAANAEYTAMGGIGSAGPLDDYLAVAAKDGTVPSLDFTASEFATGVANINSLAGEVEAVLPALVKIKG
jgi:hypothetical protein